MPRRRAGSLVWPNEERTLRDLWIVRHTVAHNGGFVTGPDARRLRSTPLENKQVLIDLPYLEETISFLRNIIARLSTDFGPVLLKKWFADAASGDWMQDDHFYSRVKLLTVCVEGRTTALPDVDQIAYEADLAQYGVGP